MRDYVIKNSPLVYKAEGRIIDAYEMGVEMPTAAEIPQQFVLHPNYPNPFSHFTTLNFESSQLSRMDDEHVRISVYDLLGRQIKQLENRAFHNGAHSVSWDGKNELGMDSPNGIYFCKFQIGKQVGVQKILLAR